MPREYRLHRKLRRRLQPRENRQRETLRDEELRRLRPPRDQDGRNQNRGRCPYHRPRARSAQRNHREKQQNGQERGVGGAQVAHGTTELMPSFSVETPQRSYEAIVERGSLAEVSKFIPARSGKV